MPTSVTSADFTFTVKGHSVSSPLFVESGNFLSVSAVVLKSERSLPAFSGLVSMKTPLGPGTLSSWNMLPM